MAQGKTIWAEARLDQKFPVDFAIYDLGRFINGVSLQKDPEVTFHDDHLELISENSKSVVYFCSPEVVQDPYRDIKLPPPDIEFSLAKGDMEWVKKAAAIWGVENVIIVGDGKSVTLRAVNINNPASSSSEIKVGESKKKFQAVFKVDNFNKPLALDYKIGISSKGFARFAGEGVEYLVLLEAEASKFV
jgi:hypothetical protein